SVNSSPRHGTQGASLGAGRAALCARPTGAAAPERFSALRPPLDSGSVKQGCKTPGAKNAPRERDGLFDIVRWELPKTVRQRTASSGCPEPPHPEERACGSAAANQVARARVSKDGAAVTPSCFETHRSAAEAVAAAVLARASRVYPTCAF